ncbi:unnamed protein product [Nyctereutes procyonoides]|uniref:(raccoon dog) hypothetical protein n=1 Tax=Nyctereutes procyonoides TaxID=34880 RepID=A0A811YJP8_NYCPR|nr:unnamed protein product [Nyctereutes procyonoides]
MRILTAWELGPFPEGRARAGQSKGQPHRCPGRVPTREPVLVLSAWTPQQMLWTPLICNLMTVCPGQTNPDLLTCGRCLLSFPLEAITAFLDPKELDCQLFSGPGPCQGPECRNPKASSCLPCGRQFAGAWSMLRHAQRDPGPSTYQTEPAEATAPLQHPPEAEHHLPSPLKILSPVSNLKVHVCWHAGWQPQACDPCPYTQTQNSKFNRDEKPCQQLHAQSPRRAEASQGQASATIPLEPAAKAAHPNSTFPGSKYGASGGRASWGLTTREQRTEPAKGQMSPRKMPEPVGKSCGPGFCGKHFTNSSNPMACWHSHTGRQPHSWELCSYACTRAPGGTLFEGPHCCVSFGLCPTLDKHLQQKHPELGGGGGLSGRHALCCPWYHCSTSIHLLVFCRLRLNPPA